MCVCVLCTVNHSTYDVCKLTYVNCGTSVFPLVCLLICLSPAGLLKSHGCIFHEKVAALEQNISIRFLYVYACVSLSPIIII